MKANDLSDIRRVFAGWHGAPKNVITELCDEVQALREQRAAAHRTNAELARALSGHLHAIDATPNVRICRAGEENA